jgi:hypothetical protein
MTDVEFSTGEHPVQSYPLKKYPLSQLRITVVVPSRHAT